MNSHLETYTRLLHHDAAIDPSRCHPPALLESACALLSHARATGPLPLDGPWRLSPDVARELTRETGLTPPGGWHGLASLLSGTDAMEVRPDGLHDLIGAQVLLARGEEDLQKQLVEALTVRLVPPTTAAGLFLLIGLHPAWGLRLANSVHAMLGDMPPSDTVYDPRVFPSETLDLVERGVFGATLSVIFEALRTLEASSAYPIELLAALVWDACRFGHDMIAREHTPRRGEIDLFIDHMITRASDTRQRATDFTILDLLDHFLVPAGIARRFDDHTFCVWPEKIPREATIYRQGQLSDSRWLCRFLTGDITAMVA